jgi:hypothetical protein
MVKFKRKRNNHARRHSQISLTKLKNLIRSPVRFTNAVGFQISIEIFGGFEVLDSIDEEHLPAEVVDG